VTETFDENENEFGVSRLEELIRQNKNLGSEEIAERIITGLKEFAVGNPSADDVTLLILKRVI